jgi:hypothetical protein
MQDNARRFGRHFDVDSGNVQWAGMIAQNSAHALVKILMPAKFVLDSPKI